MRITVGRDLRRRDAGYQECTPTGGSIYDAWREIPAASTTDPDLPQDRLDGELAAPSIVVETDGSIQANDLLRTAHPTYKYAASMTDEVDALFGGAVYENVTPRRSSI